MKKKVYDERLPIGWKPWRSVITHPPGSYMIIAEKKEKESALVGMFQFFSTSIHFSSLLEFVVKKE
jgi:hypothetical protein